MLQDDYYIESGKIVYTELYHLKRGYCCGNGCRHCPYKDTTVAVQIDVDDLLLEAVRDGLRDGIKKRLSDYQSPLNQLLTKSFEANSTKFQSLLDEAIASCVSDPQFCEQIKTSTRHIVAKELVNCFGDDLKRQLNTLKSNPMTRARVVEALENIVQSQSSESVL